MLSGDEVERLVFDSVAMEREWTWLIDSDLTQLLSDRSDCG